MPSWNIHTAHAERLLREGDPASLGITDANAFLFGNLLPDVYVGWMVPDVSRKIGYTETHLAEPIDIPSPDYEGFFRQYALATADVDGRVSDVVLGAWAHLLADNIYNTRFRAILVDKGLEPSPQVREQKQADFATFGRTLDICEAPVPTPELLAQCAAFPQYHVGESDVRKACVVMAGIVVDNAERHVSEPAYNLLDEDYFRRVPQEVDALIREGLQAYAAGDVQWGRER